MRVDVVSIGAMFDVIINSEVENKSYNCNCSRNHITSLIGINR